MRVEAKRPRELIWRAERWISGRFTFFTPEHKLLILP